MNSWLDHLNAIIVTAGAIFLIAALMALRSSGLAEGTRLFAGQAIQRSLTDQVQIDFDHIGVERPPGAPPILEATASRFAFYGVADTLGTPAVIVYETEPDGSGGATVFRSVDGVRARAGYEVTAFVVTPLDIDGTPTSTLASVRGVAVRAERALPFGDAPDDVPMSWATVVRPIALQYPY